MEVLIVYMYYVYMYNICIYVFYIVRCSDQPVGSCVVTPQVVKE